MHHDFRPNHPVGIGPILGPQRPARLRMSQPRARAGKQGVNSRAITTGEVEGQVEARPPHFPSQCQFAAQARPEPAAPPLALIRPYMVQMRAVLQHGGGEIIYHCRYAGLRIMSAQRGQSGGHHQHIPDLPKEENADMLQGSCFPSERHAGRQIARNGGGIQAGLVRKDIGTCCDAPL